MQGGCSPGAYYLLRFSEGTVGSTPWGSKCKRSARWESASYHRFLEATVGSTRWGSTCKGSTYWERVSYHQFWRLPLGIRAGEIHARGMLARRVLLIVLEATVGSTRWGSTCKGSTR